MTSKKILHETDVVSDEGKILITQSLKVRHKKSQFEYTVASVEKDVNGELVVYLRMPEEPRFKPKNSAANTEKIITDSGKSYDVNKVSSLYMDSDEDVNNDNSELEENELLAVPRKEFESDYEVK